MGNEMVILQNEARAAFEMVLTVGKDAANQLSQARQLNDPVAESMAMAFGIAALQDAIKSHPQSVSVLLRMAGHKWGFKTDKDSWDGGGTQYKPEVIIPCFCEALMNQLRPIGNEFNIITGSTYTTKEGWAGLLSRLPGVTEVDSRPGAIVDYESRDFETKKGDVKKKITASVSATADCKVWGQEVQVRAWKTDNADERLQLSVIAEEIDEALDQLKGKADARILERLHQKVVALSLAGPQGVAQAVSSKLDAPKALEQAPDDAKESRDAAIRADVIQSGNKTKAETLLKKDKSALDAFNGIWSAFEAAADASSLKSVGESYAKAIEAFSKDVQGILRSKYQHCLTKLNS